MSSQRRHFKVATFLNRLDELERRNRETPPRMNSAGRRRANNSLPGIDFSGHREPLQSQQPNEKLFQGQRRHASPVGFFKADGISDGPLIKVAKHSVKIVDTDARKSHIVEGMVGCDFRPPVCEGRRDGVYSTQRTGGTNIVEDVFGGPRSRSVSPSTRFGRRIVDASPRRSSLELGNMKPLEEPPTVRVTPAPLPIKHHRRCRQYCREPASARSGEERTLPDFGHRAMLGPPRHFEPATSRKASVNTPIDNLLLSSCVPLSAPEYHPLTTMRGISPRRGYDVVTLHPLPSDDTKPHALRTERIESTPRRQAAYKNRTSSPNILAWE